MASGLTNHVVKPVQKRARAFSDPPTSDGGHRAADAPAGDEPQTVDWPACARGRPVV
jgi:hypothetical protein